MTEQGRNPGSRASGVGGRQCTEYAVMQVLSPVIICLFENSKVVTCSFDFDKLDKLDLKSGTQ